MRFFALLVLGLCLLAMGTSCETMMLVLSSDKAASFEHRNDTLYVNGILGKTAFKRFNKALEDYPQAHTLVMDQVPGSMNDEYNVQIGVKLHQKGLTTVLHSKSMVASGGVDLFLAGVKRIVAPGAMIGVHSWAGGSQRGDQLPRDHEEHKMFLDYYQAIDIDSSFYWFTLQAAPAEDIHWMTAEEMKRHQMATED